MSLYLPRGFGWLPTAPDFRDYTLASGPIADVLARLAADPAPEELPPAVDLREYFLAAEDQLELPTSCAQACTALVQYFERRAHGRVLRPARLMLHHNSVRLAGGMPATATGVDLRTVLKAMIRCGIAPEQHWPYERTRLDAQPEPFLYSFRQPYEDVRFFRLDERQAGGRETLDAVRALLAAGFPACFGMQIPDSLPMDGQIPYRPTFDRPLGGQAFVAVGYDDRWLRGSRGALLVRGSWGTEWGDAGYGWLPYAYVEQRLAVDFFTLIHPAWIDSGEFTAPRV